LESLKIEIRNTFLFYVGFVKGAGYDYTLDVAIKPAHMVTCEAPRFVPPGQDRYQYVKMQFIDTSDEAVQLSYGQRPKLKDNNVLLTDTYIAERDNTYVSPDYFGNDGDSNAKPKSKLIELDEKLSNLPPIKVPDHWFKGAISFYGSNVGQGATLQGNCATTTWDVKDLSFGSPIGGFMSKPLKLMEAVKIWVGATNYGNIIGDWMNDSFGFSMIDTLNKDRINITISHSVVKGNGIHRVDYKTITTVEDSLRHVLDSLDVKHSNMLYPKFKVKRND